MPQFDKTTTVARHKVPITREIIEALQLVSLKDKCISTDSISLTKKEQQFLSRNKDQAHALMYSKIFT